MKVFFKRYFKYEFVVEDEQGKTYCNVDQGSGDIYRLGIEATCEMEERDGKFYIDGYEFVALPS